MEEEYFLIDSFINDIMNIRTLPPFWYGVLHGVVGIIAIALPMVLTQFPVLDKVTISGVLILLVNWLEAKLAK